MYETLEQTRKKEIHGKKLEETMIGKENSVKNIATDKFEEKIILRKSNILNLPQKPLQIRELSKYRVEGYLLAKSQKIIDIVMQNSLPKESMKIVSNLRPGLVNSNIEIPILTKVNFRIPGDNESGGHLKLKLCSNIPIYTDIKKYIQFLKIMKITPDQRLNLQPSQVIMEKIPGKLDLLSLKIVEIPSTVEEEDKPKSSVCIRGEIILPSFIKELSQLADSFDRPICLIVPKTGDLYIHALALICRELYRIVKGRNPIPRWISEGSKEEIEEYLRAGNMIFVVDDSKCKLLSIPDSIKTIEDFDKVNMNKLIERLYELFSQPYGFIIFHVNESYWKRFTEILKEKVGAYVKIVEIIPETLPLEVKKSIVKVCWGFIDLGDEGTFDEMFSKAEQRYYELLLEKSDEDKVRYYIQVDNEASMEHERLKIIVVKILAKELGATKTEDIIRMLKEGKIKTEYPIGEGYRADIYDAVRDKYIEIETFYGTGDPIWRKIYQQTLSKYKKSKRKAKVDIIIKGLHALLYAKKLFELIEVYREHGIEVNFFIPDLINERLVPIDELKELLRFEQSY